MDDPRRGHPRDRGRDDGAASHGLTDVTLRDIALDDLPLYEAIHCDPLMMEHLGGPLPKEGLAEKLERDVASNAAGESWILVIVPPDQPEVAAGTVTIWPHEIEGEQLMEVGWMVLPPFQGRGVGKAAVRAALDRARAQNRCDVVHAFPPVANERSNGMCRSLGFERLETREIRFRDRPLRCNHWRLDLRRDA